eukprot:g25742.t1
MVSGADRMEEAMEVVFRPLSMRQVTTTEETANSRVLPALLGSAGEVLSGSDVIPSEGAVQVQVMSIAEGQWSSLYCGAFEGFDEAKLRGALQEAWPGDWQRRRAEPEHPGQDTMDEELKEWQEQCREVLQEVVLKSAGPWADYWTFGHAACSYGYWPYVRPPYPTRAPSIDLMVNDLKRWQKIVLDLEDEFAHLRTRCSGLELGEHLEMAIASLLRHCPDHRTEVYWHDILTLVDNAITGFNSYHTPKDTAAQVAAKVASETKALFQEVDSTRDWVQARELLSDTVDERRDATRAARMRYALARCREDALSGKELELSLLLTWQHCIMGEKNQDAFREHDAYAKKGRERYPMLRNTDALLSESTGKSLESVALRACRAYLDILFFHPFDDGQSRLARLVFDFVLTRAGYTVSQPERIFLFSKSAKDSEGAVKLVELVNQLIVKPKEDPDASARSAPTAERLLVGQNMNDIETVIETPATVQPCHEAW